MSTAHIIIIVVAAVSLLLLMVLKFKISAFISLLVTSMFVGILAGMPLGGIFMTLFRAVAILGVGLLLFDIHFEPSSWPALIGVFILKPVLPLRRTFTILRNRRIQRGIAARPGFADAYAYHYRTPEAGAV